MIKMYKENLSIEEKDDTKWW